MGGAWSGLIGLRIGTQYENEPAGSIKGEEFDYVRNLSASQEGLCPME
jgi:hypothetical protein